MLLASDAAQAQANFTQVQKLDFGKWFFGDNSSVAMVTVNPVGVVSSSGPIIMLESPKPGIYNITGLPAFTSIIGVTVTGIPPTLEFSGRTFDIDNFTTQIPDADGSGNTQLRLGADLETSGDGLAYPGGTYDGQINIEIDY